MSVTEQNPSDRISDNNSFALAVAVIRERVERLSEEDKQDLYDLLPYVFSDETEERLSAQITINEILDQSCFSVQQFDLPESPGPELENWVDFVSNRIRNTRDEIGMTQTQLADASGIPQSHISRLERGEHSPTAKTIRKIADALGVEAKTFDPCADDDDEK